MNSNILKIAGIIIAIVDIIIALIAPGMYHDVMENRHKDDITTTKGVVTLVSVTSEYHRGGKGSRGTTHYIYRILATSDGEVMELVEHDDAKKDLQIKENDTITIYCFNDKYAYAPEDFYVMSDLLKTLMILPMFVGVCMVLTGSIMGKRNY